MLEDGLLLLRHSQQQPPPFCSDTTMFSHKNINKSLLILLKISFPYFSEVDGMDTLTVKGFNSAGNLARFNLATFRPDQTRCPANRLYIQGHSENRSGCL